MGNILSVSGITIKFLDDFNRADTAIGVIGNDWSVVGDYIVGSYSWAWHISSNAARNGAGTNSASTSRCYRNNESYNFSRYGQCTITGLVTLANSSANLNTKGAVYIGSDNTEAKGAGIYFGQKNGGGNENTLYLKYDNATVDSVAYVFGNGTQYNFKLVVTPTSIKGKVWTGAEPATWDVEASGTYVATGDYLLVWSDVRNNTGEGNVYIDDINAQLLA